MHAAQGMRGAESARWRQRARKSGPRRHARHEPLLVQAARTSAPQPAPPPHAMAQTCAAAPAGAHRGGVGTSSHEAQSCVPAGSLRRAARRSGQQPRAWMHSSCCHGRDGQRWLRRRGQAAAAAGVTAPRRAARVRKRPAMPHRVRLERGRDAADVHEQRRRDKRLAGERRLSFVRWLPSGGGLSLAGGPVYSCAPLRAAVASLPPPRCLSERVYSARRACTHTPRRYDARASAAARAA